MPTVMLDLPEPTASKLLAMPEQERSRYVLERLDEAEDEAELPPLSAEDIEALREGLADYKAGRVLPIEQMMAQVR